MKLKLNDLVQCSMSFYFYTLRFETVFFLKAFSIKCLLENTIEPKMTGRLYLSHSGTKYLKVTFSVQSVHGVKYTEFLNYDLFMTFIRIKCHFHLPFRNILDDHLNPCQNLNCYEFVYKN